MPPEVTVGRTVILALVLASLIPGCAGPAETPERYLFYLHGQIVEGSDGRPEHPEYGVYDYPAIVQALENEGFTVISEIRDFQTDGRAYAEQLAGEVEALLSGGVMPERISIIGASKGGGIAVVASSLLGNEGLNFVFLGTCVNWIKEWPELTLRGRILSIAEETDTVAGSCEEPFSGSDIRPEFREIRIHTGRGHGAFYEPIPEWLGPAVEWCCGESP